MKKFLSCLFLIFSISLFANDYVSVKEANNYEYHNHTYYESWYDIEKKNPAFVIWDLTNDWIIEVEQSSVRPSAHFQRCLSAPAASQNYRKSGYDQGHMCPNADMDIDEESALLTFRACNICPQTPELNRGVWKAWEDKGHKFAKKFGLVTIIAGPIYDNTDKKIGKDKIVVPTRFFKIFIVNNSFYKILIFTQENKQPEEVTIEELEKILNIHFKLKTN